MDQMSGHERNKARLEQIKERLKLLDGPLADHGVEVARLLDQDLPWLVERVEWWIEENR